MKKSYLVPLLRVMRGVGVGSEGVRGGQRGSKKFFFLKWSETSRNAKKIFYHIKSRSVPFRKVQIPPWLIVFCGTERNKISKLL